MSSWPQLKVIPVPSVKHLLARVHAARRGAAHAAFSTRCTDLEGLAPLIVKQIFQIIREINEGGTTILLVEQNAYAALKLAHRGCVMATGEIVAQGTSEELMSNPDVQRAYLGG